MALVIRPADTKLFNFSKLNIFPMDYQLVSSVVPSR